VKTQAKIQDERNTPPADEAVWCSLRHIHLAVSQGLDAELQAVHRLPLGEYELLRALATPGCSHRMAGLAMVVGLSPSGLTRAIERLERRGLVRRLPCPVDRRGASAELSEEGLDLLHRATVTHDAALHALLLAALTPAEGALLMQLRERVVGSGAGGYPNWIGLSPALGHGQITSDGRPAAATSKENP
jgi:DNA-binding MarR family transcriptional regulator